jgi:hypothetical protein
MSKCIYCDNNVCTINNPGCFPGCDKVTMKGDRAAQICCEVCNMQNHCEEVCEFAKADSAKLFAAVGLYTGGMFYPFNPKESDVNLDDITQSLSQMCRFNGHTKYFYSNAAHSLNVEKYLSEHGADIETRLAGLLHDANEAYSTDLARPIKKFFPDFNVMEGKIQDVVYKAFGISVTDEMWRQIKEADNIVTIAESKALMNKSESWSMMNRSNPEPAELSWLGSPIFYIKNLFKRTVFSLVREYCIKMGRDEDARLFGNCIEINKILSGEVDTFEGQEDFGPEAKNY